MSIEVEGFICQELQKKDLNPEMRAHLEFLRDQNRRFLEENPGLYPISPYDFGPLHVRSLGQVRVEQIYGIETSRDNGGSFIESKIIKVRNITPDTGRGPLRLHYVTVETDEAHGLVNAYDVGLLPIPRGLLREEYREKPVWEPDQWLKRLD